MYILYIEKKQNKSEQEGKARTFSKENIEKKLQKLEIIYLYFFLWSHV